MKTIAKDVLLFAAAGLLCAMASYAMSAEIQQAPNLKPDMVSPDAVLSRIAPQPDLKDGLQKIEAPKFFFATGIVLTIAFHLIKLSVIVVAVVFIVYFVRRRKQDRGDPNTDMVDSLVAAFADTVDKVKAERAKRAAEISKLDSVFDRLHKGIVKAVKK